jgi:hypothetical protein
MEPTPSFGSGEGLDAVLSIQKSPGSQPGAQIKKSDGCYQHSFFPSDAASSQPIALSLRTWVSEPKSDGLVRFLLESLILAQDERWRRA